MRRRQGDFGAGPVLSLAGAAALMLALTVFAHGLVLSLAALIIGPLPAAQTALSLSRKQAASAQSGESAAEALPPEVLEPAPGSLPAAADHRSYLVPLEGDDARPEQNHGEPHAGRMRATAGYRWDLQRRQHENKRPAQRQQNFLVIILLHDTTQAHQPVPQTR